ncbi:hypothetical protein D3C73_1322360 [compost metagenome]
MIPITAKAIITRMNHAGAEKALPPPNAIPTLPIECHLLSRNLSKESGQGSDNLIPALPSCRLGQELHELLAKTAADQNKQYISVERRLVCKELYLIIILKVLDAVTEDGDVIYTSKVGFKV